MQEMHKKMMDMQQEILSLRTTVVQDQIVKHLDQKQADAQNPLSYAEKADLVQGITQLSPADQAGVFDIIRECNPGLSADDEIELDVDQIDTYALRRLQRYVESKKPRKQGLQAGADSGGAPAKRARVDVQSTSVPSAAHGSAWGAADETEYMVADAHIQPTGLAGAAVNSNHTGGRRDRLDSLGEDEYASLGGEGAGAARDIKLAHAHAWANTGGSEGAAAAGSGSANGAWGEAASEMQAKLEREQRYKAEEARLAEQRRREEEERLQSQRLLAEQGARAREQQALAAEQQARDLERVVQERREEERRLREAQAQGKVVEHNTDVLHMLQGADV
jgi:hypothetical protein